MGDLAVDDHPRIIDRDRRCSAYLEVRSLFLVDRGQGVTRPVAVVDRQHADRPIGDERPAPSKGFDDSGEIHFLEGPVADIDPIDNRLYWYDDDKQRLSSEQNPFGIHHPRLYVCRLHGIHALSDSSRSCQP